MVDDRQSPRQQGAGIEERLWEGLDTMKERITRLEEQMKTVYNSVDRVEKKLDKLIEQGHEHDVEIGGNKIQIGNGERLFWLILLQDIRKEKRYFFSYCVSSSFSFLNKPSNKTSTSRETANNLSSSLSICSYIVFRLP